MNSHDKQVPVIREISNLITAKRCVNLGLYSLLTLSSLYAVEQANRAEPLAAYTQLAISESVYLFGGLALNKRISTNITEKFKDYTKSKMGFAHNLVQDTEHSLFHDDAVVCDSLTVPGRQVLGVKAMIGALAAPTAMSSNHWSIQIVAGAVTAVCAFEVATDALATQVRISVEKESLLNQINTIS